MAFYVYVRSVSLTYDFDYAGKMVFDEFRPLKIVVLMCIAASFTCVLQVYFYSDKIRI